jgi:N-acetylglucosamine malate deacetylase 1
MNPYHQFVSGFSRLVTEGKSLPLGNIALPSPAPPAPLPQAPVVLIFSPHPDDECIISGYAMRLMREAGARVVNVAVTQGSNKERQPGRLKELTDACRYLGFGLEQTAPNGLEKINPKTRAQDTRHWAACVGVVAAALARHQPWCVFCPHEGDANSTHVGTHFLVMDALATLPAGFRTFVVETEFWGQMPAPNLMVESSVEDLADLLAALSFHVGEVQRNPYHLRLPAWMQDNVRRGAENVGGQGGAAPNYMFATLYRVREWKNRRLEDFYTGGRLIGLRDEPGALLARQPGPQ